MRAILLSSLLFASLLPANAETLLVANRGGSTITLIDPATMQLLGTVPVGADPHEIAVSADNRFAYVSNYGGSFGTTLSMVDLQARTKLRDISIAPLVGPHGIVERNGKIWFTAESSKAVGRFDPGFNRVDWTGTTNQNHTHMLAVSGDGSTVYTANITSNTASIIDVGPSTSSAARKHIPVVPGSEGIALSPDERELWIGSVNNAGISIISLLTETVVATISPGKFAYRLVFTHDGRHVLIPRPQEGGIAVYDALARAELRVIPIGGAPLSVIVAPDNRTLYVATTQPSRVWKVDLVTNDVLGSVSVLPTPDGLALAGDPAPVPAAKKRRAVRKSS